MFLPWTKYSCSIYWPFTVQYSSMGNGQCFHPSLSFFEAHWQNMPIGTRAHKHTQIISYQECFCAKRPGNRVICTHIRETKISGVILTVLSLTPWRHMQSTVKQTLTSCLLARNIWRHAQREGRRKKEQSTKERRKSQAGEGVSPFRNTRLQLERQIEKIWRRKLFSDELDTPWIRLEGKVKVLKQSLAGEWHMFKRLSNKLTGWERGI